MCFFVIVRRDSPMGFVNRSPKREWAPALNSRYPIHTARTNWLGFEGTPTRPPLVRRRP